MVEKIIYISSQYKAFQPFILVLISISFFFENLLFLCISSTICGIL
nr:MAG TPA: hypothetical protein [Caudoviricetes sp.]DAP61666.1 MAG TPA: hypothetical protein [Bacteriophage sp.]